MTVETPSRPAEPRALPRPRRVLAVVGRYLVRCVEIDTRTLALFRVLAGLLILADLALRSGDFSFFYTDQGVVPRSLAIDMTPEGAFSFYFLSTDPRVIAALFFLQGLIAVQLIVGYKTTVATILSFLFVISLDHRNPLVLSYADTLFRLLLFWAMFLPLGERWSVDAIHAARVPRERIANVASAAILVQMVYMYFVNWAHKSTNELWTGGEATVLIFGLDDTTFLFGDALRNFPTMLQYGGLLWYYLLMFSPLLIIVQGRLRMLHVGLLAGGHLSFGLTVRIGAFPYVGLTGVLLFLQSQFWREAGAVLDWIGIGRRLEAVRARVERLGHRLAAWLPSFGRDPDVVRTARATVSTAGASVAVLVVLVIPAFDKLAEAGILDVNVDRIESTTGEFAAMYGVRQPPWTVFAPNPRTTDRYHVFVARTADGDLFDIYNDRPFTFERPGQQLQRQYPSYRGRFYMNSVRRSGFDGRVTPLLADYLCTRWREDRGIEIAQIEMYLVAESVTRETIADPGGRDSTRTLFYRHGCGDHPPDEIDLPDA